MSSRNEIKLNMKQKKGFVTPVIAIIVILTLLTFMIYPILVMEPRNVPVAIISLDQGGEIPGGKINIGELVIDKMTEETSDEGVIDIKQYNNLDKLIDAMENNKYYAAIIIPENFTDIQTEMLVGLGNMNEGVSNLKDGTDQLSEGISILVDKSSQLPESSAKLAEGAQSLHTGLGKLLAVLGSSNNEGTAIYGANNLEKGIGQLQNNVNQKLLPGAKGLSNNASKLKTASSNIDTAINNAMTAINKGDIDGAMQILNGAKTASQNLSTGMSSLSTGSQNLYTGINTMNKNLPKMKSGSDSLTSGLETMSSNVSQAVNGSGQLAQGSNMLKDNSPLLVNGINNLSKGSDKLNEGVGTLYDKTGEIVDNIDIEENFKEAGEGTDTEGSVSVMINQGKNPMIAGNIENAMTKVSANAGLAFNMSYINPVPEDMGTGVLPLAIMFILTLIVSLIAGVLLFRILPLSGDTTAKQLRRIIVQIIYCVILALFIGYSVAFIMNTIAGMGIPFTEVALFAFVASLSLLMIVIGSLELFKMPGMLIPGLVIILGLAVSVLPYEALPEFWQDGVYPWMPLRFITSGLREILYMGEGTWNDSTLPLIGMMSVGVVLLFLSLIRPKMTKRKVE